MEKKKSNNRYRFGNRPIADSFHDQRIFIQDCELYTIGHSLWVGLLLHPPKSDEKYAQKSVQLVRGSSFQSDFLQNPYFRN